MIHVHDFLLTSLSMQSSYKLTNRHLMLRNAHQPSCGNKKCLGEYHKWEDSRKDIIFLATWVDCFERIVKLEKLRNFL